MAELSEIVQQADALFDQSSFGEAANLYRQAIEIAGPSTATVSNLRQAIHFEQLQFSRLITEKHPDDVNGYILELWALRSLSLYGDAFVLCNEMFDRFGNTNPVLYSLRFRTALESTEYQHLVGDFTYLWNQLRNPKARQRILQDLLSISDPKAVPLFSELKSMLSFEAKLRRLFSLKEDTLALQRDIMSEIAE